MLMAVRAHLLPMAIMLFLSACGEVTSVTPPTPPPPTPPTPPSSGVEFGYRWQPLRVGAGGFITGLALDPSGSTVLARTDTYGAYRWDGALWQQLVTSSSLPSEDVASEQSVGVQAIAVAATDASRLYMAWNGHIYRSDDSGTHWRVRSSQTWVFNANDDWRTLNGKLSVDPLNRDTVLFGTPEAGLWRSDDGGVQWSAVTGLPRGQAERTGGVTNGPGVFGIAFDASGGALNGKTRRLYAISHRNGVYQSVDNGSTWTRVSDAAQTDNGYSSLGIANDGTVYAATYNDVYRFKNGNWSRTDPAPFSVSSVAVDPTNSARLYAFADSGNAWRSTDGGSRWQALTKTRTAVGDVTWHATYGGGDFMSTAQVLFDPTRAGRLWQASGTGVWIADPNDAQGNIQWEDRSRGIEQLVGNDIVVPSSGVPVLAAWDFGLFRMDDLNTFPARRGPQNDRFNSAWDLDVSSGTPNFVVAVVSDHRYCCSEDGQSVASGYSSDGGQTWQVFPSFPAPAYDANLVPQSFRFGFGDIAVSASDTNNIVWLPSQNRGAYYTKDRGVRWQPVSLPGVAADALGNHFAFFLNRRVLTADRVLANTFYLAQSSAGVFRSSDGGSTWQRVFSGEIAPFSVFNAILESTPGVAGHLWFTAGPLDGLNSPLRRSSDGGATWTDVAGVTRVLAFGFGRAERAGGYPTVFIAGSVAGVYGLWRSGDEGANWTRIGTFPMGVMDTVKAVAGDPQIFGRVYVAFNGTGFAYGQIYP